MHPAESVTEQLQQRASNFASHPASCASLASQLCHRLHSHRQTLTSSQDARDTSTQAWPSLQPPTEMQSLTPAP